MQAQGVPSEGEIVADKYRIERQLGRGGMGVVFQATHLVTGKQVALKHMLQREGQGAEEIERFIREARTVARIQHPNVVDIYDVGEHRGSLFLVMEYLHGRSFRAYVKDAPLAHAATVRSLLPAMRGVAAAHRRGVVHRDLTPDNVFMCTDSDGEPREAKVLDFGISKVRGLRGVSEHSITHSGTVMGTPHYMSPEQAEDSKSVDERADVYAFGVILYEALSGRVPYRSESITGLLLQIARGQARPLLELRPELPEGLSAAVMRAMACDPDERFRDMASLIAALEPFAAAAPLAVSAATLEPAPAAVLERTRLAGQPRIPGPMARRRPLLIGIGAAVVTLSALIAWLVLREPPGPTPPAATRPIALGPSEASPIAKPAQEPAPSPGPASSSAEPSAPPAAVEGSAPEAKAPGPKVRTKPPAAPTKPRGRLAIEMGAEQF